jgi:hypothetical protein
VLRVGALGKPRSFDNDFTTSQAELIAQAVLRLTEAACGSAMKRSYHIDRDPVTTYPSIPESKLDELFRKE